MTAWREQPRHPMPDSLRRVSRRPLRIAWLGPAPGGHSGVRGVATELLHGFAQLGYEIDCFLPAAEGESSVRLAGNEQVTFGEGDLAFAENVRLVWGTSRWEWGRWYSRNKIVAFASGMLARGVASLRLRREVMRRHRRRPYDLVYQFSSIETPALPSRLAREVPLVIHPETHVAGELRWLLAERRLALRSQPPYVFAAIACMLLARTRMQRRSIRRASLLVCISSVFRDHMVTDYGFPFERTLIAPNPMRASRFTLSTGGPQVPARVLVLGRISVRKGIDTAIEVARLLLERGVDVRVRVVGGPTLWSDYTALLEELPAENSEYVGLMAAGEVERELAETDVLLQASKYEPFGLTVAEALAAGVPVVGTDEVGAIGEVDRAVAAETQPGDASAMTDAIVAMLAALEEDPSGVRALARSEAERLFAPEAICASISAALEALIGPAHGTADTQPEETEAWPGPAAT
jgi:glycosyltransferase involved in cell wall biosynthesis